jgi:hypothetical protein
MQSPTLERKEKSRSKEERKRGEETGIENSVMV